MGVVTNRKDFNSIPVQPRKLSGGKTKMTKRYKPKNLTLIEVLVVSLVCLFLLAVVLPACRKPRSDSIRITCAKNLSQIGKAMLIYANDYDGEFPRAGGRNTIWTGRIANWLAPSRFGAYGLSAVGSGGQATITSSFYLLAKYTEVAPKTFVCPGDTGTTEFRPYDDGAGDRELIDLWDFGLEPTRHCSYSYHMPYSLYALTTSSEPGMAVAADRNPWINSPAAEAKDFSLFNPDGGREAVKAGNAIAHQDEGQNVLFLDGHVSFEKSPFCGLNDDNIYTYWDGGDFRRGGLPIPGASGPEDRSDSFLVNEPVPYKKAVKKAVTKQPKAIDSNDLKQTSVIATLDCPVPKHRNVIWCSTFQMAWDGFKNDIIAEPVKVLGAEELAARLNKAEASTGDLEEESFYATAGFVKKGIIEQIQKEMSRRFPSEPRPVFDELDTLPLWMKEEMIVAYSYLNVDVGFKYPFYTKNSAFSFEDSNGKRTDVTSFRTSKGRFDLEISEQVDVLYYKRSEQSSAAEFVVDLCKYTSPYQVVLALVPRRNTLRETVAAVEQKISEFKNDPHYEQLRKLRPPDFMPGDSVIVPDVLYKLTHHFAELEGKPLGNQPWRAQGYFILQAMQMIDFALSRTGVTLKSEARLIVPAARMPVPRQLYFNRPFLVYVKKRGPDKSPFFVMWVDNAELMKEF